VPINVLVRVVPGGLRCVNDAEASLLENMTGQEVEARIYKPVNPKFRRKFFAMLKTAYDMADFRLADGTPGNIEQFRGHVTAGAGYCDWHKHGDKIIAVPRSIQWAKMEDAEFENLYRDALTFICATYVVDRDQLDRMVQFM
jgi:hypothetical protein